MQIGGIGDTAFGDKSPSFFFIPWRFKNEKKGTRENKIGWGGRINKRKTKRQKS